MKPNLIVMTLAGAMLALQGCIALPPLIQVERKDAPANNNSNSNNNNEEIIKRLDAINNRLEKLEQQQQSK